MLRRSELRLVPPPDRSSEPGYRQWHASAFGRCQVCGERGRLVRHHVVTENHLRAIGADPWDLRNALPIGAHCRCHRSHHSAAARIRIADLPASAIEFAIEVLGVEVAELYLERYYAAA